MSKRLSIHLSVLLALGLALGFSAAGSESDLVANLSELLDFPAPVVIETLEGAEKMNVVERLGSLEGTKALMEEMFSLGFDFYSVLEDGRSVSAEMVTIQEGCPTSLEMITVAILSNGRSAALTVITDWQGESLIQAHHTNLDPRLSEDPGPAIIVNDMPYFYITTLRWVNGRILRWRYWWFNSHHHPNWFYSHYYWYWRYYRWYGVPWPRWFWWYHGWYYHRYWYFWSTWFPWRD